MSIRILIYSIVFFIAVSMTAEGNENIVTVNYPPDNTVMEFGLASVSLHVPQGSVDLIRVRVNKEEKRKIIPDSEFECFAVPLTVGVNIINIAVINENQQIEEIVINIFRRSALESTYKEPPSGFKKDFFHMKDRPQCAECHILKPGKADRKPVNIAAFPRKSIKDVKGTLTTTSTCYSCHRRLTSYPFVHGPSAVWSCLICHDYQAELVYSVENADTKICWSCHTKQKEEWNAKKHIHGPVNTSRCIICHNPHASENPFNLVKPTWNLCVTCHVDKGDGQHILIIAGRVYYKKHPTRGVRDPLNKGKELTCVSCHNSHASDSPKLWKFKVASGIALCRKCHIE